MRYRIAKYLAMQSIRVLRMTVAMLESIRYTDIAYIHYSEVTKAYGKFLMFAASLFDKRFSVKEIIS